MKLLITLLFAVAAGSFVRGVTLCAEGKRLPSGDFLTVALKQFVQHQLLPRHFVWIDRYSDHINPLLQEIPLPVGMDLSLLLGAHLLAALVITATAVYITPSRVWI